MRSELPRANVEHAEALALADYGPAPSGWFDSITYALHVWQRRRVLQAARAQAARRLATVASDADKALVELGRALNAKRDKDKKIASALDPYFQAVDEASRVASERGEGHERARTEADGDRVTLAQRIEEARNAVNPFRDRETRLTTSIGLRENDLRRAQARMNRTQIEMRNLRVDVHSEHRSADSLAADLEARRAEIEVHKGKLDELTTELGQVRRELAVRLGTVAALEDEMREADGVLRQAARVHEASARAAKRGLEGALLELGRAALENEGAMDAQEVAEGARTAERARHSRARDVRRYDAAIDAYDTAGVKRGAAILLTGVLIVFAMLALVALR